MQVNYLAQAAKSVFFPMLVTILCACGGSGASSENNNEPEPIPPLITLPTGPSPLDPDSVTVQMMGNSHSALVNLPDMLTMVLQALEPTKSIEVKRVNSFAYLYQHAEDPQVQAEIDSQTWSHVVLQAQRYSTSQSQTYPTDGAVSLIQRAILNYATPVLFPEWGLKGSTTETTYVHRIHQGIAAQTGACVAPIGLSWEWVVSVNANIELYASDGNHANITGTLLTAFVLAETITGQPVDLLSTFHTLDVPADVQALLKQSASQIVAQHPPCDY